MIGDYPVELQMRACVCPKINPVATAPGSVFVNRKYKILPWLVQTEPVLVRVG